MPSSSRKPWTFSPPAHPAAYWPRAVVRSRRAGSVADLSTFCFSMRRLSASKAMGSSIATSAISCRRWFWMTSRAAPMPS